MFHRLSDLIDLPLDDDEDVGSSDKSCNRKRKADPQVVPAQSFSSLKKFKQGKSSDVTMKKKGRAIPH